MSDNSTMTQAGQQGSGMQEEPTPSTNGQQPSVAAAAPTSAGAWLREAREKRGLHIAAVAAMLKVPQSKLEALEADRWQDLTDMTFARALAKAVCRTLKVDPEPVLALLPRGGERELDVSRGINKPFRERPGRDEGMSLAVLQRPLVWGPALLLIAAAVVYYMPNSLLAPVRDAAPGVAAAPASAPAEAAASVPDSVAAVAQETVPAPAPVLEASTPAPAPVAVASKPLAAVATASPAIAAPSAPKPVAVGDLLPVKLHIKADSWISVTDGRGQVLLARLLHAGEDPELSGQFPLKLTIGNVAGTELSLRGSAVDLTAQAKDNVARLELN